MKTLTIVILTSAYIFLNVIDLRQTKTIFTTYGLEGESNIVIRGLYRWFGFSGVTAFKFLLTAFVIFTCAAGSHLWPLTGLTAFYTWVVLHNRFALLDGEKAELEELD